MAKIFNVLRGRRRRLERDLDRELRYHVDRRVEDMVRAGASEAEARRQAHIEFGGVTQVREEVRETWIWRWLDTFASDVRYALRSLGKSWGFALGAGAVLALGIAANTAIFSVVHTVLLRPLAYQDADRLVTVENLWTNTGRLSPDVSGPDFLDWQAQAGLFEVMGHFYGEDDLAVIVNNQPELANYRGVSSRFFDVFGQPPSAGRLLAARDEPGNDVPPTVAVVGHRWAETHYGSAQGAIGKTIRVYDRTVQIVGVAAPGFRYPDRTEIWVPDEATNNATRDAHFYRAVAKLAPGVTVASAQATVRALGDRLAREHPNSRFKTFAVTPLHERLTGGVQATLWVLMGAVLLVLLIACANIANLLLARAAGRTREIALRTALGAGRGRVVRQLLTESFVLAGIAAIAGVVLAAALVRGLVALSPPNLPRVDELAIDRTVLLFALGLSFLSTLLFGLLPAVQASRLELSDALKHGGSKGTVSGASGRFRSALVVIEVALSVMLLAGAGLLLRSLQVLHQVDLGFNTERVLVAYTQFVVANDDDRRRRQDFYRDLLARLETLPGVTAASGVAFLPMGREPRPAREYYIEGRPEGRPGERPRAEFQVITPGYFKTLGIPLRQGRDFDATDIIGKPMVAIINESLARDAFPHESPIGRRIRMNPRAPWAEIVGVAADTRWREPSQPAPPEMFMASRQGVGGSLSMLVRTTQDEQALAAPFRAVMRELDPTVPVRIETMDALFSEALAYPRFRTQLIGAFAALAALLAAVGIFSLLAYLVGQRTREIAVRRAIGARASDVVGLILGQGVRLIAFGLTLGLVGALAGARLLEGLLYEISPWDAGSYLGAIAILGLAALLATMLPAIRAATIDPVIALRQE